MSLSVGTRKTKGGSLTKLGRLQVCMFGDRGDLLFLGTIQTPHRRGIFLLLLHSEGMEYVEATSNRVRI